MKFVLLAVFATAMGLLEAITVVYMRRLGLNKLEPIEIAREAATIIMLLMVAVIAGRDRRSRVSCFIYLFGIWDILYYVGLKIFIGWPPSVMTWDHLFYIPILWQGPVLAPIIVSIFLIGLGVKMNYQRTRTWEGILVTIGFAIIILSFLTPTFTGIPIYSWPLFGIGFGLAGSAEFPVLIKIFRGSLQ